MEDAGKVIYYERLNVLITDIAEESNRSPIDEKKLGELLRTLYSEIQLMPADEVRASALLLEIYFSGQFVLKGLQKNIDDTDKYINTDILILLLREIDYELQRSSINMERLNELHVELYEQIQYIEFFPAGKILEIATELYNSVSRLVAELSLKYLPVKPTYEEAFQCWKTCVEENRYPLPGWVSFLDVANPTANRSVGLLHRMFAPPHLKDKINIWGTLPAICRLPKRPTTWQHWLEVFILKEKFPQYWDLFHHIGDKTGAYALIPTLYEGSWDIIAEAYCTEHCWPDNNQCDNKSCALPYYINGKMCR